jgi:hypothetical protein
MIRRSLLLRLGGYDERYRVSHDFGLMLRLAETTRICFLRGRVIYFWRRHSQSLTLKTTGWRNETDKIIQRALERWRQRRKTGSTQRSALSIPRPIRTS